MIYCNGQVCGYSLCGFLLANHLNSGTRNIRRNAFNKIASLSTARLEVKARNSAIDRLSRSCGQPKSQGSGFLDGVFKGLAPTSRVPMVIPCFHNRVRTSTDPLAECPGIRCTPRALQSRSVNSRLRTCREARGATILIPSRGPYPALHTFTLTPSYQTFSVGGADI